MLTSRSQSPSQGVRRAVPIQDTAVYNVARLQESLRGEEQIVPANYDTLEKDIGEILDSEEKAASRCASGSEEKPASKGTSVHFDSPVEQAEILPEPSEPAVPRAPLAPWEGSPWGDCGFELAHG